MCTILFFFYFAFFLLFFFAFFLLCSSELCNFKLKILIVEHFKLKGIISKENLKNMEGGYFFFARGARYFIFNGDKIPIFNLEEKIKVFQC